MKITSELAFDTETTGLKTWGSDQVFAVSVCNEDGDSWYTEWDVDPETRNVTLREKDFNWLQKHLVNDSITKVFWHASFDFRMLEKSGFIIRGPVQDAMFAARICNTLELTYALKPIAKKYLGISEHDEKDLRKLVISCRKEANKLGFKTGSVVAEDYWLPKAFDPTNNLCEIYCCEDTVRTMALWKMYSAIMNDDPAYRMMYGREMKLWPIVYEMEGRGLRISKEITLSELANSKKDMAEHLAKAREISGVNDLNPSSSQQVAKVLYSPEKMGLPVIRRTKKAGQPSVDWKALRPHSDEPFVRELLAYKSSKMGIGTFFQKYLTYMVDDSEVTDKWVLHPGLNQCGTLSGRFSASTPNLQQLANPDGSVKTADPIQARAPFGPREGYEWFLFDYQQMELRLFADIANVPSLLQAVADGRDLNTEGANKAWGGEGNPAAIEAAIYALELNKNNPSSKSVKETWSKMEWNPEHYAPIFAQSKAKEWLASFDYDIVKAEKSLGKNGSRTRGKMVTFAKIYGGGPSAVKDLLFCTDQEARQYIYQYDVAFPEMKTFMDEITQEGYRNGFIINKYGRKLRVDRTYAYRACNYMIQGTAADMMKDSIFRSHAYLKRTGLDARMLITIHDELIFEVLKGHSHRWLLRGLKDGMEDHGGRFRVAMPVEIKRCRDSWNHKEEVEIDDQTLDRAVNISRWKIRSPMHSMSDRVCV